MVTWRVPGPMPRALATSANQTSNTLPRTALPVSSTVKTVAHALDAQARAERVQVRIGGNGTPVRGAPRTRYVSSRARHGCITGDQGGDDAAAAGRAPKPRGPRRRACSRRRGPPPSWSWRARVPRRAGARVLAPRLLATTTTRTRTMWTRMLLSRPSPAAPPRLPATPASCPRRSDPRQRARWP